MADLPSRTDMGSTITKAGFRTWLLALYDYVSEKGTTLINHIANDQNPHNVTASQLEAVVTSSVSATAQAGKIVQRDGNAQIAGDILGNAATASSVDWDSVQNKPSRFGSQIVVMTGEVDHGHYIPLPSGYSQDQCVWMVSPYVFDTTGFDVNEGGTQPGFTLQCYADSNRYVTARMGFNVQTPEAVRAQYIIVGVQ